MIGVGLALDASNIARTQSALQQAIDSAVLAVASEGKDMSDARAAEVARQFLGGNSDAGRLPTSSIKRDGTRITLDATSKAKMAFGGLLGYDSLARCGDRLGGHRLHVLRDRPGARHDRLDGGRQAALP